VAQVIGARKAKGPHLEPHGSFVGRLPRESSHNYASFACIVAIEIVREPRSPYCRVVDI
jgi:hypothetical protein